MSTDPATHATPEATEAPNGVERRRHPRHSADRVFTALGRVRDISRSGMRVRAEAMPDLDLGERFRLELRDRDRVCLLPARLTNTRPSGDGNAINLGLEFGTLTPAQRRTIDDIVQRGVRVDTLTVRWQPDPKAGGEATESDEETEDVYSAHDSFAGLAVSAEGDADTDEDGAAALEQLAETAEHCADLADDAIDDAGVEDDTEPAMDQDTITIGADDVVTARINLAEGDDDARDTQPGEVNQRRAGRVRAADTTTSLGQVLDISANGLRVRRKGAAPVKIGSTFMIDLHAAGRILRAPVEVVRIQKIGWRTFDYGLKFGELPDDVRAEFGRFCRMVSHCSQIH